MRRSIHQRFLPALAVGALVLAACGDDDDEPAATEAAVDADGSTSTEAPPATEAAPAT
ncbi:MAG: hypothetical protein ACR2O6_10090 [Ilumatobacteraceae bacterium]